ncbi:MAG TPA: histidinol dehydrogenase, partial [Acidimicrobiales bacterium]|nr:histidinol dehydrogenase [Acidimicrobiales bacterium]
MLQRLDVRGFTGDVAERLPAPTAGGAGPVEVVADIIAEVAAHGDTALRTFTERFDGVRLDDVVVSAADVATAPDRIDPELRAALQVAADRVRAFHEHQFAETAHAAAFVDDTGLAVDTVFRPVVAAACYVPGGLAVYPSTVLHTAIPARVAGVERVVVCVPPQADGKVPDVTLAACAIAGVDEVVSVGGAQAIAAVAYGTESIRPVDVIVGPGNIYVALAKRAVADRVGIPN